MSSPKIKLLYDVDERAPLWLALLMAVQHVMLIYSEIVIFPVIIGKKAGARSFAEKLQWQSRIDDRLPDNRQDQGISVRSGSSSSAFSTGRCPVRPSEISRLAGKES